MYVSKMEALEAYLASVSVPAFFFNEAPQDRLEELRDQLSDIGTKMNAIQARADEEGRELTEEEEKEVNQLLVDFDATDSEIERRVALLDRTARLSESAGRQTDHNPGDNPENPEDQPAGPTRAKAVRRKIPAQARNPEEAGRHGFRSLGEFAQKVKAASAKGNANPDQRLFFNAPTTVGQEGVGEDGGFAVPPDFRSEIMKKVAGEASLLSRTDQNTSMSNSFTFPKDETTPWQTSGGVQAYWAGENDQLTQSKPSLKEENVRLNKLTALVPMTDELLADASSMTTYLRNKVPEKFDFKINDAIVNGTGAGQPKGLLNADCKISQAKESGQPADTIVFNNITNMWSRLYAGCRQRAVWLINQDIETQLYGLQFPGTGTAVPVYLPPGGLSASPYGTLMGRPVIPTEACKTLGDEGDVILTDLGTYLTVMKTGGVRQDVSMHLWFDYDTTAFRFILRLGGQNWWATAIDPANGSLTRSCVVTLAARA